MLTFILSIVALIIGYIFYGKFVERFFGADPKRVTPAISMADGIDYKPLKPWKIYVIQFLNIAGLGPIFGAIMGAQYGPIAYLWIVIGCIFMGATYDFTYGMISIRNNGASLNMLITKYLGGSFSKFLNIIIIILLFAVGGSFINGPAGLLAASTGINLNIWVAIIFAYCVLATLLPIDKIIGKIYPIMGIALLLMAVGVGIALLFYGFRGDITLTNLTAETFHNYKSNPDEYMLIPLLFIVISCGAISGFHATQSPLMARCMENEKYGRPIFYGAMISEGIVAAIWATAAMAFFNGPEGLNVAMDGGATPAIIVQKICSTWLGKIGLIIGVIGVVVCPITSGDTAFRSLRLILADLFKFSQKPIKNRLILCAPIFAIAFIICTVDFSIVWTYVGISNQMVAASALWGAGVYFITKNKPHYIVTIPAAFLTYICTCFLLTAPIKQGGLNLEPYIGHIAGAVVTILAIVLFTKRTKKLLN